MSVFSMSLLFCAGLSVISSGIIIIYFVCSKKSRTYSFKLVLPVFLYDFIILLDWFLPLLYYTVSPDPQINIHFCRLQGFLKLWRTNGTFFSTLVICWVLYTFFIQQRSHYYKNPITTYASFTIILPLLMATIPLITNRYGYLEPLSQVLCYITVQEYPNGEQDILGIVQKAVLAFLPFVLTICSEIYFIVRIMFYYWKQRSESVNSSLQLLVLYPLFLVLSQIWIMYERLYEIVTGGDQISWLNEFDLQMVVINGFLNSIIYGYISLNICCSSFYNSSIKLQSRNQQDENDDDYTILKPIEGLDCSFLITQKSNVISVNESY